VIFPVVRYCCHEELMKRRDRAIPDSKPAKSRTSRRAVQARSRKNPSDRLARECEKLNVEEERALAEEGMAKDLATWPTYSELH
jgi:hypothetical protein